MRITGKKSTNFPKKPGKFDKLSKWNCPQKQYGHDKLPCTFIQNRILPKIISVYVL
jgi:hypothetical protein